MSEEYELTLNDYLAILRRRWLYILGGFSLIMVTTIIVAVVVPPVYESSGTILIESQQIPIDMVQSAITGYADERIEVIKQRVMTRENLLRIIDKYDLYKEHRQSMTMSEVIDEFRSTIEISLISANTSARNKNGATIAFKLAFQYRHPNETQRVANELVTLFLDENVKSRTERATETTEFLNKEAERLKAELETVEKQVADYKRQNTAILPEQQQVTLSQISITDNSLQSVERDFRSAQDELRLLEDEYAATKAGAASGISLVDNTPIPMSELDRLRAEYNKALATYTENHPTVRSLKRRIETMEKAESSAAPANTATSATTAPALPPNPALARLENRINATKLKINSLAQQQTALRQKLGRLEALLSQSPSVELGLATLMRDYEGAQRKYDEVRSKQMGAKISENLEESNKAERFSLIDPPQPADKPVKPDRIKILLIGFFLALGGSGGLAFLLETLNKRIWGAEALVPIIRQHPLVSIPYITIQDEITRKKRIITISVASVGIMLIAIATLLHYFYMPLNVMLFKIVARFG